MTDHTDAESDKIIADGLAASQRLRDYVKHVERTRDEQPERLVQARAAAEEARGWALLEEPLESQISSLGSVDGDTILTLPNMMAKELWGARLAFDLLDCGDDFDEIDAVTSRLFAAAGGDTGVMMTIQAAALSTIAALIVPELLNEIERSGSNYEERVRLCEARAKAWHGRVEELRHAEGDAASQGVKPIDAVDIAATALDDEGGEL